VLVVPIAHIENIYALPDELGTPLLRLTRRVATALREVYGCDGTSIRQHNEPAGNQDVWHVHIHVYPRYHGDDLYRTSREPSDPDLRRAMAADLRAWLDRHP
jgi:histidine triad (HIT) family protein